MYMANAKILRWGPNAAYIPLTRIGGLRWGKGKFCFALGVRQILVFLDTNMLVSPARNFAFRLLPDADPQRERFCVAVEYRFKS